jgi:putative transcriptional regulator
MTIFQGQKLRDARAGAGLTQKQLADLAEVQRRTIISAEKGKHVPEAEAVARIAKALGVSINCLFDGDEAA